MNPANIEISQADDSKMEENGKYRLVITERQLKNDA